MNIIVGRCDDVCNIKCEDLDLGGNKFLFHLWKYPLSGTESVLSFVFLTY